MQGDASRPRGRDRAGECGVRGDPVTGGSSVTVRRGAGTEGGIGRPVGLLGGGQRLGSHPAQRGGTLLQRYETAGI